MNPLRQSPSFTNDPQFFFESAASVVKRNSSDEIISALDRIIENASSLNARYLVETLNQKFWVGDYSEEIISEVFYRVYRWSICSETLTSLGNKEILEPFKSIQLNCNFSLLCENLILTANNHLLFGRVDYSLESSDYEEALERVVLFYSDLLQVLNLRSHYTQIMRFAKILAMKNVEIRTIANSAAASPCAQLSNGPVISNQFFTNLCVNFFDSKPVQQEALNDFLDFIACLHPDFNEYLLINFSLGVFSLLENVSLSAKPDNTSFRELSGSHINMISSVSCTDNTDKWIFRNQCLKTLIKSFPEKIPFFSTYYLNEVLSLDYGSMDEERSILEFYKELFFKSDSEGPKGLLILMLKCLLLDNIAASKIIASWPCSVDWKSAFVGALDYLFTSNSQNFFITKAVALIRTLSFSIERDRDPSETSILIYFLNNSKNDNLKNFLYKILLFDHDFLSVTRYSLQIKETMDCFCCSKLIAFEDKCRVLSLLNSKFTPPVEDNQSWIKTIITTHNNLQFSFSFENRTNLCRLLSVDSIINDSLFLESIKDPLLGIMNKPIPKNITPDLLKEGIAPLNKLWSCMVERHQFLSTCYEAKSVEKIENTEKKYFKEALEELSTFLKIHQSSIEKNLQLNLQKKNVFLKTAYDGGRLNFHKSLLPGLPSKIVQSSTAIPEFLKQLDILIDKLN